MFQPFIWRFYICVFFTGKVQIWDQIVRDLLSAKINRTVQAISYRRLTVNHTSRLSEYNCYKGEEKSYPMYTVYMYSFFFSQSAGIPRTTFLLAMIVVSVSPATVSFFCTFDQLGRFFFFSLCELPLVSKKCNSLRAQTQIRGRKLLLVAGH